MIKITWEKEKKNEYKWHDEKLHKSFKECNIYFTAFMMFSLMSFILLNLQPSESIIWFPFMILCAVFAAMFLIIRESFWIVDNVRKESHSAKKENYYTSEDWNEGTDYKIIGDEVDG